MYVLILFNLTLLIFFGIPLVNILFNIITPHLILILHPALGNLAANIELGDVILREGALPYLIPMLRSSDPLTQRMSSMALCNLSSNIRNQVLNPLFLYEMCIKTLSLYIIMCIKPPLYIL
jgi:hypothetical protein